MTAIEELIEKVNTFYHNHGRYPAVKISRYFWEENADHIAKLAGEGVEIQVVDYLESRTSFLLTGVPKKGEQIETLNDLKRYVDKLVDQGMGDWPVVHKEYHSEIYTKVTVYPITQENAPL